MPVVSAEVVAQPVKTTRQMKPVCRGSGTMTIPLHGFARERI